MGSWSVMAEKSSSTSTGTPPTASVSTGTASMVKAITWSISVPYSRVDTARSSLRALSSPPEP